MARLSEIYGPPEADDAVEAITVRSKTELETEAQSWAARASGLQIVDRASCVSASQLLKSIKHLRSGVAEFWAGHIEAAMETKRKAEAARKSLVEERDRMDAPLLSAETTLKHRLLAFETVQEQQRQAQEQALQAEAQRQAEAVTLEAAAALERQAEATGDETLRQEAADILAQPIEAPAVYVESNVPKVSGVSYRDNWKTHPDVNVRELAAAVAAGTVATTLLLPNMTALNQTARATQGTQIVPGVRFINERIVAARA